jgi:Forkhead domain
VGRSPFLVSPSYHHRRCYPLRPLRPYDNMRPFLGASADNGWNSNSNLSYDGDSSLAAPSSVFTFLAGRQANFHHNHGMPDRPPHAGRQEIDACSRNGGGQSTAPLSLDSLPSYPPDKKPPFSHPQLIRLVILGSPQKRLLLRQIYSAIEEKFPWYRDSAPKTWKVSHYHLYTTFLACVR